MANHGYIVIVKNGSDVKKDTSSCIRVAAPLVCKQQK